MRGKTLVSFRRNRGEKQKSLTIFGSEYNKEYYSLQKKLTREFYDMLIKNIRKNTYGFKLAPSTLYARRRKGISSTAPFIETGDYIDAIFVDGVSVRIARGKHKPSGLLYTELFTILEFGRRDRKIKARPVFRNTQKDFYPIAVKEFNELTSKYLVKGMKKINKANIKIARL